MNTPSSYSRRQFLVQSGATGVGLASLAGWAAIPRRLDAAEPVVDGADVVGRIADAEIRAGVQGAITKNLVASATERYYPGQFTICADGGAYGADTAWPGLDSWQMAGAYLLLGRTRLVTDYFEFVRATQRKDGNIPFAVFNGDTQPGGCIRGLKQPDDVFSYQPPKREGLPASSQETRRWIGLFEHWQSKGYPLRALAPVSYILTAAEIFDATHAVPWLKERLDSLAATAKFLLTTKNEKGLLACSGFYTELPPREGSDGVTQCYVVHAFRELARLFRAASEKDRETEWSNQADKLARAFVESFWREDHFGEYVHPQHGLVDSHGLSDVNWAAVAFGLATDRQLERMWARLMNEPGFWLGGMPTQTVTKPSSYEPWELNCEPACPGDPLNDMAAMGRVWYLEALACRRMHARERLLESTRKVCLAGKADGYYWRERYHPKPDGTISPDGAQKYCEYAAVLIRTVFGNQDVFCA